MSRVTNTNASAHETILNESRQAGMRKDMLYLHIKNKYICHTKAYSLGFHFLMWPLISLFCSDSPSRNFYTWYTTEVKHDAQWLSTLALYVLGTQLEGWWQKYFRPHKPYLNEAAGFSLSQGKLDLQECEYRIHSFHFPRRTWSLDFVWNILNLNILRNNKTYHKADGVWLLP